MISSASTRLLQPDQFIATRGKQLVVLQFFFGGGRHSFNQSHVHLRWINQPKTVLRMACVPAATSAAPMEDGASLDLT